jgi:hypothetical protein
MTPATLNPIFLVSVSATRHGIILTVVNEKEEKNSLASKGFSCDNLSSFLNSIRKLIQFIFKFPTSRIKIELLLCIYFTQINSLIEIKLMKVYFFFRNAL